MADYADGAFEEAARNWNLDPNLLRAVASGESGNSDAATSPAGAIGRMQLMPATAAGLGVKDPRDGVQAIFGAAKLLSQNLDATNGNVPAALRLYQGGPDQSKWGPQNAAYPGYILSHYQRVAAGQGPAAAPTTGQAPAAATPADPGGSDAFGAAFGPAAPSGSPSAAQGGPQSQPSPTAAPAPASPASDAADPFSAAFSASPTPADAPGVPAPAGGTAPAPQAAPVAPQVAARSRPLPRYQGLSDQDSAALHTGMMRAVDDIIDRPAEWLARGSDAIGLTSGEGDRVAALNAAGRAAYDQQPESTLQDAGRMIGQAGLTLPMLGALGGAAGGAGDVAASGIGRLFGPAAETALRNTGSLLSGGFQGNKLAEAASRLIGGGFQGATAGALTAGQSDASTASQMASGAMAGAVVNPLFHGAGAAARSVLGSGADPEVARLAQLARDKYGINLTGDQITSSPFVQTVGAQLRQLPMTGMAGAQADLQQQFTRAVSRTIGEDTNYITPAVMERAKDRIGGVMDGVAARTNIPAQSDPQFLGELGRIESEAARTLPGNSADLIRGQVSDMLDAAINNRGNIPGDVYQALTRKGAPLDRLISGGEDSNVQFYAGQVRDALDDALERAAPAGQVAALRDARLQYKNLKTIEPLVVTGPPGTISPQALQGKVNASFAGRGLRADQPSLAEIADIGRRFNLVPDSGTARRSMVNNLLLGAMGAAPGTAGLSAAYGLLSPGTAAAVAGAAGGTAAVGAGVGALLRSRLYTDALINGGLNPTAGAFNQLAPYAAPIAAVARNRLFPGAE